MTTLTYLGLAFVIFGPIVIVALLRFLRSRMTAVPFYSIGGILFSLVGLVVIILARNPNQTVQFGNLVVIQPQGIDYTVNDSEIQPEVPDQPAVQPTLVLQVTATTSGSATPASTNTPTLRPTTPPTATPAATATSEPTATPEPTATLAPTATPEPAPEVRRYTVKPGDTLGDIADRFGVTIVDLLNANDLTPRQGDALQPGDVLIIP